MIADILNVLFVVDIMCGTRRALCSVFSWSMAMLQVYYE